MPITHHPPDDTVLRYANGTLPEAPAIVVATHLSFCGDCRLRMQTYEMLGGSMLDDVAPATLSTDALSATLARLDTVGLDPARLDPARLDTSRLDTAGAAALNVGWGATKGVSGSNADETDAGGVTDGGRSRNDGEGHRAHATDGIRNVARPHDGCSVVETVSGAEAGARSGQGDASTIRQQPELPGGVEWPRPLRHYDIPRWRSVLPGVKWTALSLTGQKSGQLLLVRGIPGAKLPSHGHDGTEYTCVLTGAFSDSHGTYTIGDLIEADEAHDHQPIVTADAECVCLIAIDGHLRLHGLARLLQPLLGL